MSRVSTIVATCLVIDSSVCHNVGPSELKIMSIYRSTDSNHHHEFSKHGRRDVICTLTTWLPWRHRETNSYEACCKLTTVIFQQHRRQLQEKGLRPKCHSVPQNSLLVCLYCHAKFLAQFCSATPQLTSGRGPQASSPPPQSSKPSDGGAYVKPTNASSGSSTLQLTICGSADFPTEPAGREHKELVPTTAHMWPSWWEGG